MRITQQIKLQFILKILELGIDNEIYSKLFQKFITRSMKGTGLGIDISKNIVEAHGGDIIAENNEGGPGATFSFSLPLTSSHN